MRPNDDPTAKLEITLECDPACGPLASYVAGYDQADFDSYISRRNSDPNRRTIIFEQQEFAQFVRTSFGRTSDVRVKENFVDVLSVVEDSFLGSGLNKTGLAQPLDPDGRAYLSGPEFLELASVVITHGALPAGASAIGVAFIKATRDVVVKWLDRPNARRVKVAIGQGRSIELVGPLDDQKLAELAAFLESWTPPRVLESISPTAPVPALQAPLDESGQRNRKHKKGSKAK